MRGAGPQQGARAGQWQAGAGSELELKIVNNKEAPEIKTNGKLLPL